MKPEQYRLRPIEETDLFKVLAWRNSERIRNNMFTDRLITIDEHIAWFNRLKSQQEDVFLIFEFEGQATGIVQYNVVDASSREFSWGFYIGETGLPRGTGLIMGFLGLNFAFEKLNVRRLRGEVFSFNVSSINFHKRLGFIEINRSFKRKSGKDEEIVIFFITKENWLQSKNQVEVNVFTKY